MSDVIIKRTRIHQLGGSCLCHFEIVGHNLIKDDVETKEVFANSWQLEWNTPGIISVAEQTALFLIQNFIIFYTAKLL